MLAVFVNCFTVLLGSFVGLLFSKRINNSFNAAVMIASGIVCIVLGLEMALEYKNIIYITLSAIIGGLLGTLWDIDGKILSFGHFLERILSKSSSMGNTQSVYTKSTFAHAFLNASVLFCVGAMSIVGSFKAGIEGDYTIIFTKSVLDGFMAIVFTSAMGIGTAFSVIIIFIYQGVLTLGASFVAPYVTDVLLSEITAMGGCLIIMIGINLLEIKKIKTANFLMSVFLIPMFYALEPLVKKVISLF